MNDKHNAESTPGNASKSLVIVVIVLLVGAAMFLMKPAGEPEVKAEAATSSAGDVPAMDVIVDTLSNTQAVAKENSRYKVLIVDQQVDGGPGIARIGDVAVSVPGTRKGDVVVVTLSSLSTGGAEAVVTDRLASGQTVAEPAVAPAPEKPSLIGQVFRGSVSGKNEAGDGFVKLPDHVVYVAGVDFGQRIEFRIIDESGPFVRGELISNLTEVVVAAPAVKEDDYQQAVPKRKTPVKVGDEVDVEVTEADRRNPEENGVARINNFVVFVPGTAVGDRVKIRITDVRSRAADAEVIERLDVPPAAP
jgi:predicted RNA-binding protein with TRAM domain